MEAKEILARVKEFFNELTAPAPAPAPEAPVKLSEYEVKGGGMVTIDKLEAGGVVLIDGAPAVAGELELADGTKLVIAENGVIAEVMPGAAAEATEVPGMPDVDMAGKFAALEQLATGKFTEYETKFAAYENRFAAQELQLSKANKVIEQLLQLSQVLVDAPAAQPDPAVKTAAGFQAEPKEKKIAYDILFKD